MHRNLFYLSAAAVRRALPMREAIQAMRDAFAQLGRGQATMPARLRMDAPAEHGVALVMPSHSVSQQLFSLKMVSMFADNPQRGLPTIQSLVLLADGTSGAPLAILEGASLTAIRTGAASGLATDLLARPDAAAVAIFGAGVQARTQLEAVCAVRPIRRARVYDLAPGAAERFAAEMSERLGIPVEPVASSAKNLEDADVVCTATPSGQPVFADHELPPGVHLNAIGGYRPDMIEVPAATVCRARVVVDHRPAALEEAGDLLAPLRSGLIGEEHFATELADLVLGRQPGRTAVDETTLFKSVGVGIQDLCAAARALANARQRGLGTQLEM
jgi:ornithine cyclodeaminase/alanine dehydrogenase-like protein (mu-crystallin family)